MSRSRSAMTRLASTSRLATVVLERDGERPDAGVRRGCRCAPGAPARHRGRGARAGRRAGPGGRRRPTGPPTLWPLTVRQVGAGLVEAGRAGGPTACTASVWNGTPCSRATAASSADRLHRADLVVGPHDADQGDVPGLAQRRAQAVDVDVAAAVGVAASRPRRPRAGRGTRPGRGPRGARCRSTTIRVRAGSAARRAAYVPLTARLSASVPPGGEDDLGRSGTEHRRDALARLLDDGAGRAAGGVQRGGVADPARLLDERLDRGRQHRGRRRVVEVVASRSSSLRFARAPHRLAPRRPLSPRTRRTGGRTGRRGRRAAPRRRRCGRAARRPRATRPARAGAPGRRRRAR